MIEEAKAVAQRLRGFIKNGDKEIAANTIDALVAEVERLREYVKREAEHHCLEDDECGVCRSCRARLLLEGTK